MNVNAFTNTDALLEELKTEIAKKPAYEEAKEQRIKSIKSLLLRLPSTEQDARFDAWDKLYTEYKSYQFDSAYVYVDKMIGLSKATGNKPKEYHSYVKMAFILLSSGMFNETFDYLRKINVQALSNPDKVDYYFFLARCYYDLANYNDDRYFSPRYVEAGNKSIDSAIVYCGTDQISRTYLIGLQGFHKKDFKEGRARFAALLERNMPISMHLRAMVSCTLGLINLEDGRSDEALDQMIQSAIADIRSSTRENMAIHSVAEILYKKGDIKDAYNFIQIAKEDADFYGARQRKIRIAAVLPLIAAAELDNTEHQKNRFLVFLIIITLLAVLVVFFLVMIAKQLKKLKVKESIIEAKNIQLKNINGKLIEDARIKEEYIGQFFKAISGYIVKLENLKISIDAKLSMKKYDAIHTFIDAIDIKKERESLYYSFDHIFLKIFPNFITVFNSLFAEKDQIWPDEDEVLNTDLRIFALIRMGINDNETIAKILEYSVNTIYVYKMRIKAKSLHPEHFEQRIMDIKAFDYD